MVKISESAIKIVKYDKPKWLIGLSQTATGAGGGLLTYRLVVNRAPRLIAGTSPRVLLCVERGNPVSLPVETGTASCEAGLWQCGFGIPEKANVAR